MRSVQPASLTTEELVHQADIMLLRGELPTDWQREILLRLEKIVYGGDTLAHDPNQLSLF
jgi:hypothetical protein